MAQKAERYKQIEYIYKHRDHECHARKSKKEKRVNTKSENLATKTKQKLCHLWPQTQGSNISTDNENEDT